MSKTFHRIASFFYRISAFISKEFHSVVSQPRLLAVLILGPFLILLIFGVSYQDTYRTLRTMVVVSEDSSIEASVEAFARLPMPGVEVVNVVRNTTGALSALEHRLVDLVLVIPPDAVQKIESNQHAQLIFYHQEIDPFEAAYVEIVASRITEETNRELMISTVEQSKAEARLYQAEIRNLREMRESSQGNDQPFMEAPSADRSEIPPPAALFWVLAQVAGGRADLKPAENQSSHLASATEQNHLPRPDESDLIAADKQLTQFVEMDSQVIVEPFRYETRSLSEVDVKPVHFYVPAVLALLLQHLAISLAALSIVSERFAGTMELMRAAPVNAFETLLGKYLSFLILLCFLAAVLTILIHWVLGVPMLGSILFYALVICLVILVSLGFGFLISSFARSDSQAIQFSMVLLLASIFFSGFFLQLYRLRWPAQIISWLMPSTYGLNMLQDIMLRGIQPEPWMYWVSGGFAAALFMLNWLRLRKLMVQS